MATSEEAAGGGRINGFRLEEEMQTKLLLTWNRGKRREKVG